VLVEPDTVTPVRRLPRPWTNGSVARPAPASITVDHGTEFTSKALEAWAWRRGVKLDFTHPGKPMENGHIESFNGRLCDECLNVNQLLSLDHAHKTIKLGRRTTITTDPMAHWVT